MEIDGCRSPPCLSLSLFSLSLHSNTAAKDCAFVTRALLHNDRNTAYYKELIIIWAQVRRRRRRRQNMKAIFTANDRAKGDGNMMNLCNFVGVRLVQHFVNLNIGNYRRFVLHRIHTIGWPSWMWFGGVSKKWMRNSEIIRVFLLSSFEFCDWKRPNLSTMSLGTVQRFFSYRNRFCIKKCCIDQITDLLLSVTTPRRPCSAKSGARYVSFNVRFQWSSQIPTAAPAIFWGYHSIPLPIGAP